MDNKIAAQIALCVKAKKDMESFCQDRLKIECPFGTEYSYDSSQYYFCKVTGFDCTFDGFDCRLCVHYLMERPQDRVLIQKDSCGVRHDNSLYIVRIRSHDILEPGKFHTNMMEDVFKVSASSASNEGTEIMYAPAHFPRCRSIVYNIHMTRKFLPSLQCVRKCF